MPKLYCPKCGSNSVAGPIATTPRHENYPGRIIRCRSCWSDFSVRTPQKGASPVGSEKARNRAALAAFERATAQDMKPIPGMEKADDQVL